MFKFPEPLLKEGAHRLGQWVSTQRRSKTTLTAERLQRLEEIGFVWDPLTADWEAGFAALKAYREREGHCRVPRPHKEGDYKLGIWVRYQRKNKTTLTPERVQRLDEIGLVWDPFTADWEEGFAALEVFKKREGHCRVPQAHKEGAHRLGQWVSVQRGNKTGLAPERVQRLDEIGFVWAPLTADWEEGFAALDVFKEREGHCRVPAAHKEGDHSLGNWVRVQRKNKANLTAERVQRLDEIGFVWDAGKQESN